MSDNEKNKATATGGIVPPAGPTGEPGRTTTMTDIQAWLNAPAVLARHVKHTPDSRPSLWVNLGDGMWGHAETTKRATVRDLRDVTPLYPKEDA